MAAAAQVGTARNCQRRDISQPYTLPEVHKVIRRAVTGAAFVGLLGVVACSSDSSGADRSVSAPTAATPRSSQGAVSSPPDHFQLASYIEPWVPAGWEVQRAYRQPATMRGADVEFVAVYLRPIGDDPSPEEYLDQAVGALQSIGSGVFAADATVSAIDICLQHANDAEPDVEVQPAVQIMGLRKDLDPLLATGVQLADLVSLNQERRLGLFADEYVGRAPTWSDAMATSSTTSP